MVSYYRPYLHIFLADMFFATLSASVALTIPLVVRYVTGTLVYMEKDRMLTGLWQIGLFLAALLSENILIGLTEDRRLQDLVALPGLNLPENILLWVGLLAAVSTVLRLLVLLLNRPMPRKEELPRSARRMLFWAAVTLVCWIPVVLLRAPGGLMWDTNTQIRSFQGLEIMDASHPLLTTLIYGSLYTLGQKLWCDSFGIVLCVLLQGPSMPWPCWQRR